jgi:hypothetical protein
VDETRIYPGAEAAQVKSAERRAYSLSQEMPPKVTERVTLDAYDCNTILICVMYKSNKSY